MRSFPGSLFRSGPSYAPMRSTSASPLSPLHRRIALGCILLLAFAARYTAIDKFGTGFDELFSVLEANGYDLSSLHQQATFTKAELDAHDNIAGVRQACIASDGGNGILYLLALHGWTELFGNSNLAIRSFSLVAGLVVVVLLHALARRLFRDEATALLIAALGALAPLLVDYSQEARGYMLGTALVLLATGTFIRMQEEGRPTTRHALAYGLLAGSALLVHYAAVYILLAHAVQALLWTRTAIHWRRLVLAGAVCAAMVCTWMLLGGREGLAAMAEHNRLYTEIIAADPGYDTFFRKATPEHLAQDTFVQLLWLCGNALQTGGPQLRILALALVVPGLLIAGMRAFGSDTHDKRLPWALAILALSGTGYALATSLLAGHTFGMRYYYAMFSGPFALMLIGGGAMRWLRDGRIGVRAAGVVLLALQAAIMGLSVLGFYAHGYRGNYVAETVAPAAERIEDIIAEAPQERYLLVHATDRDALALNLHLGDRGVHIPQQMDARSPYRTVLLGERGGEARVLFTLRP